MIHLKLNQLSSRHLFSKSKNRLCCLLIPLVKDGACLQTSFVGIPAQFEGIKIESLRDDSGIYKLQENQILSLTEKHDTTRNVWSTQSNNSIYDQMRIYTKIQPNTIG